MAAAEKPKLPTWSLLQLLQDGPQESINITNVDKSNTGNTESVHFNAGNIKGVEVWANFNIQHIIDRVNARYPHLLSSVKVQAVGASQIPLVTANNEDSVRENLVAVFTPPLEWALRATYKHLQLYHGFNNLTEVEWTSRKEIKVDHGVPDKAFMTEKQEPRMPCEIKPSHKWSTPLNSPTATLRQRREYNQVLSQLNYYMEQMGARMGFILTNEELVAVQRTGRPGHLRVAPSVPFTAEGEAQKPRLTVTVALWYLAMIATRDDCWKMGADDF